MTDIKTVLTDQQKAQFVADICNYGTGFVAPLFSVVESIEAAVLAASAPAQAGGVVAWITDDYLFDPSATTYDSAVAQRWRDKGWRVGELRDTAAPVDAQDAVDAELLRQARDALNGMLNKHAYGCGYGSDYQVERHNTAANAKATEAIAAIDAALQASQSPQDQVKP